MNLFNLLTIADPVITFLGDTFDISLNFIGKLIKLLITGIGIVGVGIIVFSIILKLIVMPLDVYQRIAMRKQNITMKENKEQLEKLQKQYANDKDMYNKKMAELYKSSGINMLSSCLPMIVSLVVFIVAINAFNSFSQYANLQNYKIMVDAYNGELVEYCSTIEGNITETEIEGKKYLKIKDETAPDKYIYFTVVYNENYAENDYQYIRRALKNYYVDVNKAMSNNDIKIAVDKLVEEGKNEENPDLSLTQDVACVNYFINMAQDEVVKAYNSQVKKNMGFGWIKNIWVTDASFKHPVLGYNEFKANIQRDKFNVYGDKVKFSRIGEYTNAYNESSYNMVTGKLVNEKKASNGYYILIVLSIGTILLQQFVTMRSQKEQTQFSSVDGQAASTQKVTMVIMTVMFAVFSFMYSSAFSIYMITSNILSLVTTLVINKVVDKIMDKKESKEFVTQHNNSYVGRNYTTDIHGNKIYNDKKETPGNKVKKKDKKSK